MTAAQQYAPRNTMMWKTDPGVEKARRQFGWREFHKECGRQGLYFDDIEPKGRGYEATAFTLQGRFYKVKLVTATGKTPIDACVAAMRASGHPLTGDPATLFDEPATVDDNDDFDALL